MEWGREPSPPYTAPVLCSRTRIGPWWWTWEHENWMDEWNSLKLFLLSFRQRSLLVFLAPSCPPLLVFLECPLFSACHVSVVVELSSSPSGRKQRLSVGAGAAWCPLSSVLSFCIALSTLTPSSPPLHPLLIDRCRAVVPFRREYWLRTTLLPWITQH